MRIAHLLSNLSYGGAEQQVKSLCVELRNAGHEINVASMKSGGELVEQYRACGLSVTEFGMRGSLDPIAFLRVQEWLKHERPDILHTHLFKADVFGAYASGNALVISTKWNLDQYLRNPLFGLICRKAAKHNQCLIAVSESVKTFLVQTVKLPPEKIEVIRPGISTNPDSMRVAESDKFRIGVVARLVEQKGHDVFLRGVERIRTKIKHLQVFLYGSGPLESKLRKLVEEMGLGDVVRFQGVVLDKQKMYSTLDLLVLPSRWEGAPVVLLEAMSCGIPIVATEVGGTSEILTSECGLLVPAGKQDDLASAILRMAEQPEIRLSMGDHCRKRVTEFTLQKMVDRHLRLYERILNKNVEPN